MSGQDGRVPAAPSSIGCADEAQGLRPSGNDLSRKGWPNPGDTFSVIYPFVRAEYDWFDVGGPIKLKTWRPGISVESADYGDVDIFADSQGEMILAVIATFKPGRFPTRVFYTRQFVDPDGKAFGKGKLLICTLEKFHRISVKYQVDYDVEETFEEAAERRSEAQAIEARSGETEGLDPKGERAVPKECAQDSAS